MCKSIGETLPDYKERLAFGTDQGRWLNEQVGQRGTHKRTNSGHVFHEVNEQPVQSSQNVLIVDSRLQRVAERCKGSMSGGYSRLACLTFGMIAITLIVMLFVRRT